MKKMEATQENLEEKSNFDRSFPLLTELHYMKESAYIYEYPAKWPNFTCNDLLTIKCFLLVSFEHEYKLHNMSCLELQYVQWDIELK